MSAGGRLFSVQVPDWGQDHLTVEAVVAYVDGELAERPYDRATQHLFGVSGMRCADGRAGPGPVGAAVGAMSQPAVLADVSAACDPAGHRASRPAQRPSMGPDGELVAQLRPGPAAPIAPPPAGLWPPHLPRPVAPASGAGAAIAGLALGALAIGADIIAGSRTPSASGSAAAAVQRRPSAAARRALTSRSTRRTSPVRCGTLRPRAAQRSRSDCRDDRHTRSPGSRDEGAGTRTEPPRLPGPLEPACRRRGARHGVRPPERGRRRVRGGSRTARTRRDRPARTAPQVALASAYGRPDDRRRPCSAHPAERRNTARRRRPSGTQGPADPWRDPAAPAARPARRTLPRDTPAARSAAPA